MLVSETLYVSITFRMKRSSGPPAGEGGAYRLYPVCVCMHVRVCSQTVTLL